MADRQLSVRILLRNDTASNWTAQNPVLSKGEMGIESDTRKFKFGDGVNTWSALKYASATPAVVAETDPTITDKGYDIGITWVNTANGKIFTLTAKTDTNATWTEMAKTSDLSQLGYGDMLKSKFATNSKVEQGYVDKAILADSATAAEKASKLADARTISLAGDVTGSVSFNGTDNVSIESTLKNSGVVAGTYSKVTVNAKGIVTAGENLTQNDITGKIDVSKIDGLGNVATLNTGTSAGNVVVVGGDGKVALDVVPDITLSKVTNAGTAASKNVGTEAGQIPVLGENGKISETMLPAIAITDTFTVANESEMLALTAQKGDVAIRTDLSKSFILKAEPASEVGNWVELKTPADAVQSVNGKTGAVTLTTSDIGEGTNLYFTQERAKEVFDNNFNTAFDTRLGTKTTDNVAEGDNNLYYTEARATASFTSNFAKAESTSLKDSDTILRSTDTFVFNCGSANA